MWYIHDLYEIVLIIHSHYLFIAPPLITLLIAEAAKLSAADLHKPSSQAFALYKKRPLRVKVKRSGNPRASALLSGYQFDYSDAHVKEVARELVKDIPSYETEIQVW